MRSIAADGWRRWRQQAVRGRLGCVGEDDSQMAHLCVFLCVCRRNAWHEEKMRSVTLRGLPWVSVCAQVEEEEWANQTESLHAEEIKAPAELNLPLWIRKKKNNIQAAL